MLPPAFIQTLWDDIDVSGIPSEFVSKVFW